MSEHTPGPWFVADRKLCGGSIIVSHGTPEGGGDSIADVSPSGPWVTEKTALADAHLIAAAPELLAALQAILHPDNEAIAYFVPSDSFAMKLRDDARAAVAKALGKETAMTSC